MNKPVQFLILTFMAALPAVALCQQPSSPAEIFQARIMPIFRSPNPSSCVQCHLASVDLKDYIMPTSEKTFVSLRDQGLIDLEKPESSKILKLIEMGDQDRDDYSKRIHEKMRRAEYAAFSEWIIASCKNKELVSLPKSTETERAIPSHPNEIIRHARKSRVVNSFARNVWSQRMRCFPCHTPHQIGPKQKIAREKFDGWYEQFGDQMLIFKKTPEETLRYLINESKNTKGENLPLLNLDDPGKSLLLLKPMAKVPPKTGETRVPTYSVPVYHMGGLKIHYNDHSHKAFLNWIEDYVKVTNGKYKSVDELPADNWYPTQRVLRLKDLPESWEKGSTVQMFIYKKMDSAEIDHNDTAKDAPTVKNELDDGNNWSDEPIAFTQGTVTPKRLVNGPLILLAPTDTAEFDNWKKHRNRIPPGDYLVKIYHDHNNRLADNPTAFLTESEFVGKIEIVAAKWRAGFPKAEWISGKDF